MGNFAYKQFSERHRPHIHPPGSVLFVTYRLAGSIPKSTVREYRAKKEMAGPPTKAGSGNVVFRGRARSEHLAETS